MVCSFTLLLPLVPIFENMSFSHPMTCPAVLFVRFVDTLWPHRVVQSSQQQQQKNLSILCLACYNLYYYFPICNKVPLHQWCEFVCNRVLCCGWERACTDGCELEKGGCKRNLNGQWNHYPLNVYPPLCTCLFTPHLVNTILQVTHMRFAFKYMGFRAFLSP